MDAADLQRMLARNGLYILADDVCPGATFHVVVMGAEDMQMTTAKGNKLSAKRPGHVYVMRAHAELSPDPSQWRASTRIAGGPYSLQTCEVRDEELNLLDDSVDFWRNLAVSAKQAIMFYRDMMLCNPDRQAEAFAAQALLDEIAMGERAEETAAEIAAAASPVPPL